MAFDWLLGSGNLISSFSEADGRDHVRFHIAWFFKHNECIVIILTSQCLISEKDLAPCISAVLANRTRGLSWETCKFLPLCSLTGDTISFALTAFISLSILRCDGAVNEDCI